MAVINGVKIGTTKSGKLYIFTPEYNMHFKTCMNNISAQWLLVDGKRAWVCKPEHLGFVEAMVRMHYKVVEQPVVVAEPVRTDAEAFAVAMGLGLRAQEDLS